MRVIKIFFTGMVISFIGSLPPGTLNVAAMQLSITNGFIYASWFAAGSLLPEIFYVLISLLAIEKLTRQKKILQGMDWIMVVILLALALSSFIASASSSMESRNILLSNMLHPFLLGLIMSAVNPAQIPFWLGWNTILLNKKILLPSVRFFNFYTVGIAAGSFAGSCVYMFGGRLVVENLNAEQHILQLVIGIFFTLAALVQIRKLILHKNGVQLVSDK